MPGFNNLTPRERWNLLLIDEPADRFPIYPLVTTYAAVACGCDLKQYCTNASVLAQMQLTAQRKFAHEGLSVFTDVGVIAEGFGSKYDHRSNYAPFLVQPIVKKPRDLISLSIPNPENDGRLPVMIEAALRLFESSGDILPVFLYVPGPFTTAGGMRGVEDFLMDCISNPDFANDILEVGLEAAIRFSNAGIMAGALPVIVEPLASGSVISRKMFSCFALPNIKRLIHWLHRYDMDVTLHICGNSTPFLDLIIETEADLFSFDQVDIVNAVGKLGDHVRLIGNIPPESLMPHSQDDLERRANDVLSIGEVNPKGFVFSTGCEVPLNCEPNRLMRMIKAGVDFNIRK